MKDALLRVIDAALTAKELDEKMLAMGYGKTPYSEIYGKLEEALYIISGESDGMEFEGSMTQTVLTNPFLCLERRAAILEHVRISNEKMNIKNNDPVQPCPDFIPRDEMRKMVRENGGYMVQEAERPE